MSYQGSFRKRTDTAVSMANVDMNSPVVFESCKVTTKRRVTSARNNAGHLSIKEIREAIQSDFYVTVHSWFVRVFFGSMLVLLVASMISVWYGVNHQDRLICREPIQLDDDSATDSTIDLPEDVSPATDFYEVIVNSTTWTIADGKNSTHEADGTTKTQTSEAIIKHSTATSPQADGDTTTEIETTVVNMEHLNATSTRAGRPSTDPPEVRTTFTSLTTEDKTMNTLQTTNTSFNITEVVTDT